MRAIRSVVGGVALALTLAAFAGCADGPPMGEVFGTVQVDGKPVSGAIGFTPTDGKTPTSGGEIKDGKYSAKVYAGSAKVEIRIPKVVGKKKLYDTPDSPIQDIMEEVLPAKYNDATELILEVKTGKNEKNWDLNSK